MTRIRRAALLTPANIDAFVDRMRHEWSATTLFMTILKLYQIARHLAPLTDFKWLREIAGDLKAEDGPVKRQPIIDASELLSAGLALVDEYSDSGRADGFERGAQYSQRPNGGAARFMSDPRQESWWADAWPILAFLPLMLVD